ncbi:unnamed protein product [Linum trigynum]|uniref:Aldehyde dehydrogenase n=1 Tax=Linum trigynum TaxID=586398 RepID=A0AAV2F4I8_9ROSI
MKMERVDKELAELRHTFRSGKTRSLAWRETQLKALLDLVHDHQETLFDALHHDLGKHPVESFRDEIGVVKKSATHSLAHLKNWMKPRTGSIPLIFFPASGKIVSEPFGVVLIIGSWNFPISLVLDPLIGAISAGNTVLVKPSELAPLCSSFLLNTIPNYLDPTAIKVVEGGVETSQHLLNQKWDKIFFTGSKAVGRIVLAAAAQHLTPVTLELGGKCPAIVDLTSISSHYDTRIVAKRIVGGKWGPCSGQACIGVDYLLVEEKHAQFLIDLLKKYIRRFYGEHPKESNSICRIVNRRNFERVQRLLKDPAVSASIVAGGFIDEERQFIDPTILLNPPLDSELMTEEIFGPLLPIITLNDIGESIEFINSGPKPLTIYPFTKDEKLKKMIVSETSSGGVTFNDTMVQFLCDSLPFGGVGESGLGRYHGKYSFDTFSHEKAVMERGFYPELEPRYPPWNSFKLKFIQLAYNFDYFGLGLLLMGLKKH